MTAVTASFVLEALALYGGQPAAQIAASATRPARNRIQSLECDKSLTILRLAGVSAM